MRYSTQWPENTAIRKQDGFLLFPMSINGEGRFWEHVAWYEECVHYQIDGKPHHYEWRPVCWADNITGHRSFLVKEYLEEQEKCHRIPHFPS